MSKTPRRLALAAAAAALLGWGPAAAFDEKGTNTQEDVYLRVTGYDGRHYDGPAEFKRTKLYVRDGRTRKLRYREVAMISDVPVDDEERLAEAREDYASRSARLGEAAGDAGRWARLGAWARGEGLRDEARAALERAIELDPDEQRARHGLGFVRDGDGWVEGAAVVAGREAELAPDDLDGRVELARWALRRGVRDAAFGLLHEVLRRDNFHSAALELMRPLTDQYRQKTALVLPVSGRWAISPDRTRHHALKSYAVYALDLNKVDDSGDFYRGDGRDLEDHYAFGAPFYAMAAGTVVEVRRGFPDNPIGELDESVREKHNGVSIDHGGGELSWYVHAKAGSIVVEEGDRVEQGQKLGEVGNSGGSAMPHLHVTLVSFDRMSVPWACDDYTLIAPDGTPIRVTRACPREGWTVVGPERPE